MTTTRGTDIDVHDVIATVASPFKRATATAQIDATVIIAQ